MWTLRLTSRPVGEILRYSLTSLLLSMALILARLTFSYVNCRPSFKTEPRDRGRSKGTHLLGDGRLAGGGMHVYQGVAVLCTRLLTQIVKTPLGAEPDLPFQVVRMLRPQLQDSQAITDAGLRNCQLVLTCAGKSSQVCVKTAKYARKETVSDVENNTAVP